MNSTNVEFQLDDALYRDYLKGQECEENNGGLELPGKLMTGTAGNFAKLYGQYLEAPPEFFYFGLLTILGAALSDRLTLESELKPEPRFFTVLLGQSADERKSTAINKVVSFFREYFPDTIHYCYGIGSAEGLQARLKEIASGKLVLVFDELKQLVSKCKIEGSVLLPCINTLFENDRYESRTKKTDIQLENIRLSFIGASTVQTYENMWTSQFIDIGFNNRLFLVPGHGERKNPIPQKVPATDKKVIANQINSIFERTAGGLDLSLTDTAMDAYDTWYFNLERSIHARRIDTYCMRLLPLLAVNDHKKEIDIETVFKATAIMDWQLMVRGQLDPIDATSKIAKMEEKIRRKLRLGPMAKRQLQRAVHANRDGSWVFNTALKNLSEEVRFNRGAKCYEMVSIE